MDRSTRKRLREINRRITKLNNDWDDRIKKSGKSAAECSGESWYAEFGNETIDLQLEETKITSDSLEFEARSLWLPIPSREDATKWEESNFGQTERLFLSPIGMTELRTAIRKERGERRAVTEWWLKTLGAAVGILTGLIGALIGLVSVLRK
jgi:hypothetical protein